MDAARRFLIHQPTGGELIEFLRIVELQAATSQAARILLHFAQILEDTNLQPEWQKTQQIYAAKTQSLWRDDWFYDFDTRAGRLVSSVGRDLGQVAPIFCGIASDQQTQKMRPALRKFYTDSLARQPLKAGFEDWQDGLHWSSLVLPYVESLCSAGELELVSQVIHSIVDRVYKSTDRRALGYSWDENKPSAKAPGLGWPGVSCEIWGAQGAYGGEGYGWGAVLPAHIIRNLIGFRDPEKPDELPLLPNLPAGFMAVGKTYRIRNLQYREASLTLEIEVLDSAHIRIMGAWTEPLRTLAVTIDGGANVPLEATGRSWQFKGENRRQYTIHIAGMSDS